jgi:glycosyltransferase involved in cell wall biosynthesis
MTRPELSAAPREPRSIGLLPAYNAEATVADAAFSLFPTKTPFELLIVDDGSREPVADTLARDPRYDLYGDKIHVLRKNPNSGLIDALNDGLAWILARDYDYVIRMDSDDIAVPGRVDAQVAFMQARPHLLMAGGLTQNFEKMPGDGLLNRWPTETDAIRLHMRITSCISHPTFIVRADTYRKVGGYDHRYLHAEDFEWLWRCMRAGPIANLGERLIHWRMSPAQVSTRHWRTQLKARARVLLREFLRGDLGCAVGVAKAGVQLVIPFRQEIVRTVRRLQARAQAPL